MTEPPSQGVLKRLAAFAVAFAAGSVPATALGQMPETVVEPLLEDDGLDAMDDASRGRLLRLLAAHPSDRVRERVASRLLERPTDGDDVEAALLGLVRDDDREVRWAATAAFCRLLARQEPLERARLMSEWALAPSAGQRLAVAAALATVDVPLAATALELLAADPDPAVRIAASRARKRRG